MAERLHATAVASAGSAVLLRGASRAGKSDLALRMLALPTGPLLPHRFELVADDQVLVEPATDPDPEPRSYPLLSPPPALAGLLEVRGLGIVRLPFVAGARLRLVAALVAPDDVPRMPDPPELVTLAGMAVPLVRIAPFEASAAIKLALALAEVIDRPTSATKKIS